MNNIIENIDVLVIVGLILWLIESYLPLDPMIKRVIVVLIVIILILWLFSMLGAFGSGGLYLGHMLVPDSIATDAQGNVYTGEGHHGKRLQKWVAAR